MNEMLKSETEDLLLAIPSDRKLLRTVGILNELNQSLESRPEYSQAIIEAINLIDLLSVYREQAEESRKKQLLM